MPSGEVLTFTVCGVPTSTFIYVEGQRAGICPTGQVMVTGTAYIVHPSEASKFDALLSPFDYAMGTQFWALGFTTVLGLHVASHMIGVVLNFLKRA